MDKVITTMLLMIAAIVATVVVVNAVMPSVQSTSADITAASDVVGGRLRTDARIIEATSTVANDEVYVWVKNTGASTIPNLDKMDVFFGETTNFERVGYDIDDECPNPSSPPRPEACWQYQLENSQRWDPAATLRITIYLDYTLSANTDYVVTVVLSNGIRVDQTFSL